MYRTIISSVVVITLGLSSFEFASPLKNPNGVRYLEQPAPQSSSRVAERTWPRGYSLPSEARVLIYQPQVASWENQKHIVALAAVAYTAKDAQKPALGTIKIEGDTAVAVEQRLVKFSPLKITEINFQSLAKEQTQEIVAQIEKTIPEEDRTIGLDDVLSSVDKSQIIPKTVDGLKADPPTIFLSTTPAILVNFDGEPIWSPIKDNELKFAVNTNWDVFQHGPTALYYLRNEGVWLRATDVKGPWSHVGKLPESFGKLPADDNWKDVRANLPGKPVRETPHVYVSTRPAELILIQGEPKYVPVLGTGLLWISNTESDLFRLGQTGPVFYLVAGRWFRAPNLNGNWTFATPNLPEDFSRSLLNIHDHESWRQYPAQSKRQKQFYWPRYANCARQ